MSKTDIPAIKIFQMQHDEFYFLGKEYPMQNADFRNIWNDFISEGGYERNSQYHVEPYTCMIVYHNINPDYQTYMIGAIVEETVEVPEGYSKIKFPAREFLVVTTDWQSTHDEVFSENGSHAQTNRYINSVQIPDGYVRYNQTDSRITLVEVENCYTENGNRWEFWVPIRKQNDNSK